MYSNIFFTYVVLNVSAVIVANAKGHIYPALSGKYYGTAGWVRIVLGMLRIY